MMFEQIALAPKALHPTEDPRLLGNMFYPFINPGASVAEWEPYAPKLNPKRIPEPKPAWRFMGSYK